MKNKKGYTLIELLAVIVILAIIALIATPIILNMINDVKKNAAINSSLGYIDSVEKFIIISNLTEKSNVNDEIYKNVILPKDTTCIKNDGIWNSECADFFSRVDLRTKGKIPSDAKFIFDSNSRLQDGSTLKIEKYNLLYNNNNVKIDGESEVDNNSPKPVKEKLCKRATILHTEGSYTFGSLGTNGVLTNGDAFDCDVNGDGIYDNETERFYFMSYTYNSDTRLFDSEYAAMIYYSNYSSTQGEPTTTVNVAFDAKGTNYDGPVDAVKELPTREQWPNAPKLYKTKRQIVSNSSETPTKVPHKTLGLVDLPEFDYSSYAARLPVTMEISRNFGDGANDKNYFSTGIKQLFMEKTKFVSSSYTYGYWFENVRYISTSYVNRAFYMCSGTQKRIGSEDSVSDLYYGVRPVIDVKIEDIDY